MKNVLAITGVLLVLLAQQLLPGDDGLRTAVMFLGGSMCLGVCFLMFHNILDQIVAENSRDFYIHLYEEYMVKQQEAMRKIEEEIVKYQKG